MSHQGEAHRHDEDAWWRRLYDDDGTTGTFAEPAGVPSGGGCLDDDVGTALRMTADEAAAAVPAVPALRLELPPARVETAPPADPLPEQENEPDEPHDAPPEAAAAADPPPDPPQCLLPVPAAPREPREPRDEPVDELGESPPADGPPYVGDRPPTYEPEPTAWPCAEPDRVAELVPDTVLDGARYGTLTVRAASVRGDSARYRGRSRGDALLTARFGSGDDAVLFAAVASGGRAAQDGPRAAGEACRVIAAAVGRSHRRLAEDIRAGRRGALKAGLQRLIERAYGQARGPYAPESPGEEGDGVTAALRCLLLPVDPECRTRVFFGAGPGGLFRLRDGEWQDLDPDLGISPEPDPAADPEAAGPSGVRFRFRALQAQSSDTLLLCSGGLADPLREQAELAARLAGRWGPYQPPPGLAAFLTDAQTRVKGYADDRTAVAVWEG